MTTPSWADADGADSRSTTDGYTSPVMSRLGGMGELTLDLLHTHVPTLHAGHAAQKAIDAAGPGDDITGLIAAVTAGFAAQETLVMAAIPLVKHVAHREMTRRSRWRTQVTFEDLFQEGIAGLLRGLQAYNPNGNQKSPTNYLGQWIQVEMRRNVEAIDNDFGVAYDATERFRKIRALRSRLTGELGREPTDEEILTASLDPTHRGGRNIGRLVKNAQPRRPLTQAHLDEERLLRNRVGATTRLHDNTDDNQPGVTLIAMARPLDGTPTPDIDEAALQRSSHDGLAAIIAATLTRMNIGATQSDVIARNYGLNGTSDPASARDIATALGLQRANVSKILTAFTTHMTSPHGAFHQVCAEHTDTDLHSVGLGWVMTTLGTLDPTQAPPVPDILTRPMTPTPAPHRALPTREVPHGRRA